MAGDELRAQIEWHREYNRAWDADANAYVRAEVVAWGKTRRLGVLRAGRLKAYIGVQHIDTTSGAWDIEGEPFARFFVSLFRDGRSVTLRTFASMDEALAALNQWAELG
ncbi:MAG TPA: hypothetical protein VLQ48_14840 [Chloroflexia bacterium]|nr:hypothetical protein [Chloroflexia bacterium]